MRKKQEKKIHGKSFTSLFMIYVTLIMGISGIILYFAPPGRIAHWAHWQFWALTKEQWQALHVISSLAFIIAFGFHLYYNWSIFVGYLKKKMQAGMNKKRELVWSTVFSVLLVAFTLLEVPPFSTIMVWSEDLSNSWSSEQNEPPIPHAELMTVEELANNLKLPLDGVLSNLKRAGIEADSTTIIIKDLAEKYKITPKEVFDKFYKKGEKSGLPTNNVVGRGFGRKSVMQICEESDIPLDLGLSRLKQRGIEAKPDDNIRDISSRHSLLPIEVVEIIRAVEIEHNE